MARCLQIALACRAAGHEVLFAGTFEGVAAELLDAAGHGDPAARGRAPRQTRWSSTPTTCRPRARRPRAARCRDRDQRRRAGTARDARARLPPRRRGRGARGARLRAGVATLRCSPARARVRAGARLRRRGRGRRGRARGGQGAPALARACRSSNRDGSPGLYDELEQADVAVSAAGVTAYELACAGVPAGSSRWWTTRGGWPDVRRARPGAGGRRPSGARRGSVGRARRGRRSPRRGPPPSTATEPSACATRLRGRLAGNAAPPVLRYRPATAARPRAPARVAKRRGGPRGVVVDRGGGAAEHAAWFDGVLADPRRTLLVIEGPRGPERLGALRRRWRGEAEISVIVAPALRGEGIGSRAIRQSCELYLAAHPRVKRVRAEIREDNPRSAAAFTRAGFERAPPRAPRGGPSSRSTAPL